MAQTRPSISELLNGPSTAPGPSPEPRPEPGPTVPQPTGSPAPTSSSAPRPDPQPGPPPPPTPPQPPPPPPPKWPTPAAPTVGGGPGHIKYETAALRRFAQTSDERAASFQQALHEAQDLKLGWNSFGVMFGQLCRAAYDQQVQEVTEGCTAGQQAMASIAAAMLASADHMDVANQAIKQSAAQAGG
jgi:hypothetical protein